MRKLLVTTVIGLTMVFGFSAVAMATTTTDPNQMNAILAPDDATNDNGQINANQTGVGVGGQTENQDVIKNATNADGTRQKTHGEYQNNTNSCASCHQTHTAAAKNLLMKSGVVETCTACHDGTLGFYNVYTASSAGTFGGTAAGNASMHLPDGSMQIKAAPGGNRSATDGTWTGEFTCASCHSPHGSYSDRLLNYNPNDIANTPAQEGGLQVLAGSAVTTPDASIVTAIPTADANSPDILLYSVSSADTANYPAGATGQALIVMTKKLDHGTYSYIRDKNPWIAGGEYGQPTFTRFLQNVTTTSTTADEALKANQVAGITINYAKGYASAATDVFSAATTTKIVIARASFVKFDENYVVDPTSQVKVTRVLASSYDKAGYGIQITQFCAACHTDYKAASGSPSGVWSQAFRHTTNADNYTCLKCHFAHGTDVNVMLDAKDQSVQTLVAGGMTQTDAQAYLLDKNSDSALKRYTNMSVCWKCHTKSHSLDLTNNQWVQGTTNDPTAEFNTQGTNLPSGWQSAPTANLPYAQDGTPTR